MSDDFDIDAALEAALEGVEQSEVVEPEAQTSPFAKLEDQIEALQEHLDAVTNTLKLTNERVGKLSRLVVRGQRNEVHDEVSLPLPPQAVPLQAQLPASLPIKDVLASLDMFYGSKDRKSDVMDSQEFIAFQHWCHNT